MVLNFVHNKCLVLYNPQKKIAVSVTKMPMYLLVIPKCSRDRPVNNKRTDSYKSSYILYKRNINVLLILVPKPINKMSSEKVESLNDALPEPYIPWGYLEGRGRGAI